MVEHISASERPREFSAMQNCARLHTFLDQESGRLTRKVQDTSVSDRVTDNTELSFFSIVPRSNKLMPHRLSTRRMHPVTHLPMAQTDVRWMRSGRLSRVNAIIHPENEDDRARFFPYVGGKGELDLQSPLLIGFSLAFQFPEVTVRLGNIHRTYSFHGGENQFVERQGFHTSLSRRKPIDLPTFQADFSHILDSAAAAAQHPPKRLGALLQLGHD